MRRLIRFSLAFIAICSLCVGCASQTPEERVAATRAEYKATLNSFFVKETPLEPAQPDAEEGQEDEPGDEAAADGAGVEGEDGEEPPAEVPMRQDAVLDVIVQHDSASPLAGITVDISMVDAAQNEVQTWRRWIDTEGLPKANQRPYSITFEDVQYEEGYGFFVEIRHPIPAAERSQYREFEGL